MDTATSKKSLLLFLFLVVLGSTPLIWLAIRANLPAEDPRQLPLIMGIMWMPALASVIARLVFKEGFGDISFRLVGWNGAKAVAVALVFPAVVGILAYGAAWVLGLATFSVPSTGMFVDVNPPMLRFSLTILCAITVFAVIGLLTAAGEEIGWRGFLVPRLVEAGVPFPLVASGLIWALWHVPGVLSGIYASSPNRWLSAALFLLFGVGLSVLWGRLRLKTGSVWPAMLGHAAWNQAIPVFTRYFPETTPGVWLNESGILVVAAILLATVCLDRWGLPRIIANQ
jgi:uncharacterized protein